MVRPEDLAALLRSLLACLYESDLFARCDGEGVSLGLSFTL